MKKTIKIKVNNGFMHIPAPLVKAMGLGKITYLQVQEKIRSNWYASKLNRFGTGLKIVRWNGHARALGSRVKKMSQLMTGHPTNPFELMITLTPIRHKDGRKYYPISIIN